VKTLARKRQEAPSGGNAPWMNTFADLMNLLLCFFVMLFAMSDVNEAKFEQISISMANSYGIFEGGGSAIGTGQLISSGVAQLNELDKYFQTMGRESHQSKIKNEGEFDPTNPENTEEGIKGNQSDQGAEGAKDSQPNHGNQGTDQDNQGSSGINGDQNKPDAQGNNGAADDQDKKKDEKDIGLDEALKKLQAEMAAITAGMYDEVSDLTEKYKLDDYVELNIDPEYQYVQLTLKGNVLYDSGSAEIKKVAEPILAKIGDILLNFEGYTVEIIGHTDNVPINNSQYVNNNWLSSARALNAATFLIEECDINPKILKYSGRGEYEPISSNKTAEGRAKNRRIEIRIYNEYSGK
jgi:chemotaxis protein MotB